MHAISGEKIEQTKCRTKEGSKSVAYSFPYYTPISVVN